MGFQIVLATVPDLITMVVLETGEPISSDELRFGLRVAVVALPASPLLTTPQALKVSATFNRKPAFGRLKVCTI